MASMRFDSIAARRSGVGPETTSMTSLFGSRLNFLRRINAAVCDADPKPLTPSLFPLSCSSFVSRGTRHHRVIIGTLRRANENDIVTL